MSISDGARGAFDSFNFNAGLETSLAASIEASPEYYSRMVTSEGPGSLDFDRTFTSLDNGEQVRLIASMSYSAYQWANRQW
ncbi:MAG TPA: hypothetical protein PKK68_05270 [Methanothrix soehngenii]|nr:hypothetical protein [Methanothrix soehngenii]